MPPREAGTLLICPLTAHDAATMRAQMEAAGRAGADAVECRLDSLPHPVGDDDLEALLADAPLPVIATDRPRREGGAYEGDESERLDTLRRTAAAGVQIVDVEADVPDHDRPDAPRTIVSLHDFTGPPADLDERFAGLLARPADIAKIAFAAAGPEDALRCFDLLRTARRAGRDALVLAMGEHGVLSRIAAGKFGAFGTFASLESGAESAPGQPTLAEMLSLYRFRSVGPDTQLFGVIGCPVAHSMSPAIHNAAFEAAGVDGLYVPLRIEPGADNFRRFLDAVRERPWTDWRGLSVTIPHKENALAWVGADRCDELAVRIGAVNTITSEPDGTLRGDNTDYAAAMDALCDAMDISREELSGRAVAVLGAGGAARAIVAALAHYGAETTVYNRTLSRAEALAGEFGAKAAPLDAAARTDAGIVINCTPIGMHPHTDASPLGSIPDPVEVVFDTIYNPVETRLLRLAEEAGCRTVSGLEMFVNQGVAQFERWTNVAAPRDVMRRVVLERLGGR